MSDPLVSVIVSAYNRPELLRAALDSLAKQTFRSLELIVQDDSTNDECERVVREIDDPRLTYTHNAPSLGTAANLLAGYRKATGKYFCTLNDDDLYDPSYVESMVRELEANPAVTLAFSDHYMIDGAGTILTEKTEQNTRDWKRDQLVGGIIEPPYDVALLNKSVPAMFALFRRDAIDMDDFPDDVSSGYDYWMSYLAVREGRPIFYSPERLAFYRTHAESQTAGFADPLKRLSFARYSQFTHARFLADARLHSIHHVMHRRLAEDHRTAGFALLRLGRNSAAANEFRATLRLKLDPVAFAALLLSLSPSGISRRVLQLAKMG